MGEGLKLFAQGLSAALTDKAAKNGRTLREQLPYEHAEMREVIKMLEARVRLGKSWLSNKPKDKLEYTRAQGFLGLVYTAMFLMGELQDLDGLSASPTDFINAKTDTLIRITQMFETAFEQNTSPRLSERANQSWNKAQED